MPSSLLTGLKVSVYVMLLSLRLGLLEVLLKYLNFYCDLIKCILLCVTQLLGNWICFRQQVARWGGAYSGPLEIASFSQWFMSLPYM
jgi:hypothetical protein